jgi:hypothetical protein
MNKIELKKKIREKIKDVTEAELSIMPNGESAIDDLDAGIRREWDEIGKLQEELEKLA